MTTLKLQNFIEVGRKRLGHQRNEKVHPLTCGVDSNHTPLRPVIDIALERVILVCEDCGYMQKWSINPDVLMPKEEVPKEDLDRHPLFHTFRP